LGGIAARKDLDRDVIDKVDRLIRKSLEYSFNSYPQISPYIKEHAQAMEEHVMRQHIELYVNDHSIDLGEQGKKAIEQLYKVYQSQNNLTTTAAIF
jgi:1,4-dihydroxy-6-naphthoate synthase